MNTQIKPFCGIQLRDIELNLHLGWPAAERLNRQPILVSIILRFDAAPKACITDNLEDTVCYDELIQALVKDTEAKEFKLIEHLAYDIYQLTKARLPNIGAIKIAVAKKPPIPQLTGGVTFYYGDE